jgi:hypothetical protein
MLMAHYRASAPAHLPDNRPVPLGSRFASRLTLWGFAAALVLKSAVPMLAAASAGLQGKPVAEICDVYGVATLPLAAVTAAGAAAVFAADQHSQAHDADVVGAHQHVHAHAGAPNVHAHVHAHAAAAPVQSSEAPLPAHHHGSKAGDHCVLTGMVAMASGASSGVEALAPVVAADASIPVAAPAVFDAAARWTARLEHGPPAGA